MTVTYIIGIDEAGRGPLAGPVSVGAVIASADFDLKELKGIRDSKKLSERQREEWFKKLKHLNKTGKIKYAVTLVGAKIIDEKGISFAVRKAIRLCLKKIDADCETCSVLLDGSLKAPKKFARQKTIIGGDDKEPLISLAAIAAKVTRDRKMKRYAKKFAGYGFELHMGYGTKAHLSSLKRLGPCEIHRKSFLGL